MSRINPEKFDWERIEKALQVESEYGYKNIQGKLYRFSEFLCLTFGDTPPRHKSSGCVSLARNR